MQRKRFGQPQILLPEIGFGTWNYSAGVEPIQAAVAHGSYFIDTAETYGTEEIVGKAILESRRRIFLATKISPKNFRRKDVIAAAEASLRRLRTDYIDLYQLHWPNYAVPIEETMGAMEELADQGKIRFIGVSNFSVAEMQKAQRALSRHTIFSNQVLYNLIDRTIEADLLPYCRRIGVAVIAYSPLAVGLPRIRANDPKGTLRNVAEQLGKTEAQVALNWVIASDDVIAIPKASTVAHAAENCGASDWRLSHSDYETLTKGIRFRQTSELEVAARRAARRIAQRFGKEI